MNLLSSNTAFAIVAISFLLLVLWLLMKSSTPTTNEDPGELQYEMDNVDREALRISREIMKVSSEEELWRILGNIRWFELTYHENPNAYDHGKALRAQYDDKLNALFGDKKAVA